MSLTIAPSTACRMLSASGCTYFINGKFYGPVKEGSDPYGHVIGWNPGDPDFPWYKAAGDDNIDAVMVGTATINNSTAIVVAFRGTLPPALNMPSILDWLQDFKAEPVTCPSVPGKVHGGLLKAISFLQNDIIKQINSLQQKAVNQLPLYITGHSKGAGMASVFAAMIYFQQLLPYAPTAVYTFASPHAGDTGFVSKFPSSIPVFRYENYLDMVPFLVPDASFVQQMENAPCYLEEMLGFLISGVENWNYAPLGKLMFIPQGGGLPQPLSSNPSAGDIVAQICNGEAGLEAIAAAHSCDGGYLSGSCAVNYTGS